MINRSRRFFRSSRVFAPSRILAFSLLSLSLVLRFLLSLFNARYDVNARRYIKFTFLRFTFVPIVISLLFFSLLFSSFFSFFLSFFFSLSLSFSSLRDQQSRTRGHSSTRLGTKRTKRKVNVVRRRRLLDSKLTSPVIKPLHSQTSIKEIWRF